MGSLDRPDEPRRAEQADAPDQGRSAPQPRELPDPNERDRAYDAMLAHFSAATEAAARQQPDQTRRRSYQDEAPKHLDAWADHNRRWPPKSQSAVDRPVDSPSSADAIGRVKVAEPTCSAYAQAIEQETMEKHGGWLAGFEHRLKGEGRLREKIAAVLEVEPHKTPSEALSQVADAIRYTYCFQPETYTRGYYDIRERFESRGCEMYFSQNWWTNPEYKGINTRWVTSEGQRFEVQFHTPDSFHAKHHVTHKAYERIRDPTTSREELRELHAFQRQVCELIEIPDGAADIPNYRKEGF